MIEPDDVESARACLPPGVEVILRIDQKSILVRREVAGPAGVYDHIGVSQKHAATLGRCHLTGMGDGGVEGGLAHDHSASTTIAMPMPPPIHRAATP